MVAQRNIKLVLGYDGTAYHGFQIQKNARTVQGELKGAVEQIVNHPVKMITAARTDTGVHAMGQVVNFKTDSQVSVGALKKGLNALCPRDISVHDAEEVGDTFHARFSAKRRSYVYIVYSDAVHSCFLKDRAVHIPHALDEVAMSAAMRELMGEKDFGSFRAAGDSSRHSIRNMYAAACRRVGNRYFFYFQANAFLQHMIRNIMGTLIPVGKGKISVLEFKSIIEKRDRSAAGETAPPWGLYLVGVSYN